MERLSLHTFLLSLVEHLESCGPCTLPSCVLELCSICPEITATSVVSSFCRDVEIDEMSDDANDADNGIQLLRLPALDS